MLTAKPKTTARHLWARFRQSEWSYIVALLVATRIILWVVAYFGFKYLTPFANLPQECLALKPLFSSHALLAVWGNWDTSWYLQIARSGYPVISTGHIGAVYAFFPLYPILIFLVQPLFNGNLYLAGLVLSNIFLVVSCWLIYRITLLDTDAQTARRAVKYLVLLPTAFLFSAALSESLFTMLALASWYLARRGQWWLAGTAGLLLTLTRPVGLFIVFLLLVLYVAELRSLQWRHNLSFLALGLPALGLAAFAAYCYFRSGDALAFLHIQSTVWQHVSSNPFGVLIHGFTDSQYSLAAIITAITLLLLVALWRYIGLGAAIFAVAGILLSLSIGNNSLHSILRYDLLAFPLAIGLARVVKNQNVDGLITISLAVLQAFFLVLWANCWLFAIL